MHYSLASPQSASCNKFHPVCSVFYARIHHSRFHSSSCCKACVQQFQTGRLFVLMKAVSILKHSNVSSSFKIRSVSLIRETKQSCQMLYCEDTTFLSDDLSSWLYMIFVSVFLVEQLALFDSTSSARKSQVRKEMISL